MADMDSSEFRIEAQSIDFSLLKYGPKAFRPLLKVVFLDLGLSDDLIAKDKLELFMDRVTSLIRANEYHNQLHVTDVVQTTYAEIQSLQQHWHEAGCPGLSKLEQLAMVVAAAGHDLAHPGTTNQHQVAVQRMPKQHNGHAPALYEPKNEKMHALTCSQVLEETGLLENLSEEDRANVTHLVSTMILHTDMAQHFGLLEQFRSTKDSRGGVAHMTSASDRQLLCSVILHMADISNPARPWEVAYHMGRAITGEMMAQYALEQELKQQGEVSSDDKFLIKEEMAPSYGSMPRSQRGFITTFVRPLLDSLADVIPGFYQEAMVNLEGNLERWDALANNTSLQG